jgi:hypothetical protein
VAVQLARTRICLSGCVCHCLVVLSLGVHTRQARSAVRCSYMVHDFNPVRAVPWLPACVPASASLALVLVSSLCLGRLECMHGISSMRHVAICDVCHLPQAYAGMRMSIWSRVVCRVLCLPFVRVPAWSSVFPLLKGSSMTYSLSAPLWCMLRGCCFVLRKFLCRSMQCSVAVCVIANALTVVLSSCGAWKSL